ncbi:MAG: hypothetical protein ACPG6V_09790 [Flavobacteriales bacterium]
MAYCKKNYYKKVLEVQKMTIDLQKLGLTNTAIFNNHIRNRFFISKRTFDEYLGVPAALNLQKIIENEYKKSQSENGDT